VGCSCAGRRRSSPMGPNQCRRITGHWAVYTRPAVT
jgi:hypothetical protein